MHTMKRYALMRGVLAAVLCLGAARAAAAPGRTVTFHVVYADGAAKDLPRVPADNKGIRGVTRVTRIVPAGPAYEVLSTHGRPVRSVNGARTERVALAWNGKAWVGPAAAQPAAGGGRAAQPPERAAMTPARREEILNTEALLEALRRLEAKYSGRLAEGQKALSAAPDDAAKAAAARAVAQAGSARDSCVKAIAQAEARLADLVAGRVPAAGAPGGAAGAAGPAAQSPRAAGVIRPVQDADVLPHRVQVWPLAPGRGTRTYRVSMAHTEAGTYGAFYYVAYADTDADGTPDTLIARSPLAQADRPGGWTVWTFQTDAERVFAGNTWPRTDTTQFRAKRRPGTDANWAGLPEEIYVSGTFGAVPTRRHKFWPYLHNIRVQLHDGRRSRPARGGTSEIIIRQRSAPGGPQGTR